MEKYFVSYFFKNSENEWGIGNCVLNIERPITGHEDIREVEARIRENARLHSCTLINYKKMCAESE